jgi:hypothetical protein
MMAQEPQVTLMLVNVPPNVHAGEQMVVMTPTGQQFMVVVPQGAGPGSQFQIAVPRTDPQVMPPMGMPAQPGMQAMQMGGRAGMQFYDQGGRGRGLNGRGRGRKRKEKDLNRAPRQPSAYNLFMKTEIARIKGLQPELSHKEAFKEAAKNWGLSDQGRRRGP